MRASYGWRTALELVRVGAPRRLVRRTLRQLHLRHGNGAAHRPRPAHRIHRADVRGSPLALPGHEPTRRSRTAGALSVVGLAPMLRRGPDERGRIRSSREGDRRSLGDRRWGSGAGAQASHRDAGREGSGLRFGTRIRSRSFDVAPTPGSGRAWIGPVRADPDGHVAAGLRRARRDRRRPGGRDRPGARRGGARLDWRPATSTTAVPGACFGTSAGASPTQRNRDTCT